MTWNLNMTSEARRADPHVSFRTKRSWGILLLTAAWTLTLLLPVNVAKTYAAPFTEGDAFFQNQSGTNQGEHALSIGTGKMELFAQAALGGAVETVVRIGGIYPLNEGDLLTPFSAATTTKGQAMGTLNCINLVAGTEASMNLQLKKWRWDGGNWLLEQSLFVQEWRCPIAAVVLGPFSGGGSLDFEPGQTYRVMVEALARAVSVGASEATVDFCGTGTPQCGLTPDHVTVTEIKIPNQGPRARFNDATVWYVNALINGATATGRGCDVDGAVDRVTIAIDAPITGGATTTNLGAECGDASHTFLPLLPGAYAGRAVPVDNEGAAGLDVGELVVSILPPLSSAPTGFPDLGTISPARHAVLETILSPDGSVASYRLVVDGEVAADTTPDAVPPGAHVSIVEYELSRSWARVTLDGQERWAGPVAVAPDASAWWNLVPVPSTSIVADSNAKGTAD